jgi:glutamyl-tRNA(Gln) amidotransferase subunit E
LRDDAPDFTLRRKLRAVAGEGGTIDVAAKLEQAKDKTFIYQGYDDTTCLVETDCEPPHEVNKEALYTCLQLCRLAKAEVSPVVQVMRKTVVDGSNTSGFQRTALIARNGEIETSEGMVRIENISLEEDACKIVEETPTEKIYRLDRLGIPLIEIGTAPDIKSLQQCQETAKKIGYLLRSLPGVKRGLGTIRQDLNISIAGGNRIEIKGAQDLQLIPQYVELEVK